MPCATPVGAASPPQFGIPTEELSLKTESVSLTLKADAKELKNGCGEVTNVAFYNRTNEVEIVGYGVADITSTPTNNIGEVVALGNAALFTGALLVGTLYITEVNVALANEDYIKSTVKLMSWDGMA